MKFPARFDPTKLTEKAWRIGENQLDMHAMNTRYEYFAVLGQMMWVQPGRAKEYYFDREIAWVKHNVFKDHVIVPWQDNVPSADLLAPSINLSRQFKMVGKLHIDWAGR